MAEDDDTGKVEKLVTKFVSALGLLLLLFLVFPKVGYGGGRLGEM